LDDKCCLFAILRLVTDSQRGNTLVPTWEHFSPNVGMFCSQRGNSPPATSLMGAYLAHREPNTGYLCH